MARKQIAEKYIVRLSEDERARLNALITVGKHPARQLLKARILLKADVSEAGDGWPDSRIAEALDTSPDTILRTRQRLAEEGLDAALTHKYSSASVRPRIFDGAAEAKLIALACASEQLIKQTRVPIAAKPCQPARVDYEHERNGTANLFMMFAPLEGWRRVKVTDRHAAVDYAEILKELSDTHFPDAAKIVLVQDNLSTHKPASLYEAFPPAEARRLAERFEWHYTPKHGSWLDMAECELSVLSRQCLNRRMADKPTLTEEVAAWQQSRNNRHAKADWHFTNAEARIKLKRLYPAM